MYAHANYCMSGDHTLAAACHAVQAVVQEEGDDYFVFLLSDANLAQYGVSATTLAAALLSDERVNSYAIFIASEAEAETLRRAMPVGHAHLCLDTTTLPNTVSLCTQLLGKREAGKAGDTTTRAWCSLFLARTPLTPPFSALPARAHPQFKEIFAHSLLQDSGPRSKM